MTIKVYWVIVNANTGAPVPPMEDVGGPSEGMLVYPDVQSAEQSCTYHKKNYDVDCEPVILGNETREQPTKFEIIHKGARAATEHFRKLARNKTSERDI